MRLHLNCDILPRVRAKKYAKKVREKSAELGPIQLKINRKGREEEEGVGGPEQDNKRPELKQNGV